MSGLVDEWGMPYPASMLRPSAASRSFNNSSRGRLRRPGHGPIGSANSHRDERTLEKLIRDCQHEARNNPIARTLMHARSDFVVGSSPIHETRSEDKDWNKEVEARFADWSAGRCDSAGQMTLAQIAAAIVNAMDDSGGILAHKVGGKGGWAPRIELIEAIRLKNPPGRSDSRFLTAGVELSESTNRPVAYHVADWNEQGTSLTTQTRKLDSTAALLINNPRLLGPNQHRAEPGLAAVLDKIEALTRTCEASLVAHELAAMTALVIQRENAQGVTHEDAMAESMVAAGLATSTQDAKDRGLWLPGGVMELNAGESVFQVDPKHPSSGFEVMFWTELHAICAALDLPLELVYMRFTNNFAASRSAISVGWRKMQVLQAYITSRFLTPIYLWWLAGEIREGGLRMPKGAGWNRHGFILPAMPSLDPKAEAEAQLLALAGGITTHRRVLLDRGEGDRAQFMEAWKAEHQENTDAGLTYGQPLQITRSEQQNPYELQHEEADAR
jgi:lambda family phage portal protein